MTQLLSISHSRLASLMSVVVLALFLFFNEAWGQTSVTYNTPGTYTWLCPPGVTSITVECWGGGGGGGGVMGLNTSGQYTHGGGGAGGGYVKNTALEVTPGTAYTIFVGLPGTAGQGGSAPTAGGKGGDSYFGSTTTVLAIGGNGGAARSSNGSASGGSKVSTGNVGASGSFSYYGGAGGTGTTTASGGGGGSAGTGSDGNDATNNTGGAAVTGGVAGRNGVSISTNGSSGNSPGGGGSGARSGLTSSSYDGGSGGAGQVIVTINTPSCIPLFEQNFSNSTIANYSIANPLPNFSQFNEITTSSSLAPSITSNKLRFDRSNGLGAHVFSRITDFSVSGSAPTSLICQFKLTVSGNSSATGAAGAFRIGDGMAADGGVATDAQTHSRLAISHQATAGQFKLRSGSTDGANTYGGEQSIFWVINNSGSSMTYRAPDGSNESIANDTWDVWVGTTKEFNDQAVITATKNLTDIKFAFNSGTAVYDLDDFSIDPIPSIPASSLATSITSSAFTANWNAVTCASGYRLDVSTQSNFSTFVTGYENLDVANVTTYPVTGLTASTQYYYRIRSYNTYAVGTFTSGNSNSQTVTTGAASIFYSNSSTSNTDANNLANWNSSPTGSGSAPTSFTIPNQIFIIQGGHNYRVTAEWTGSSTSIIQVSSGGSLDINAQTLSTWQRIDIAGSGISSSGALLNNSSSAASLSIPVTLTAASTIMSSGNGGLILAGNINNGGFLLTVGGANATSVSTGVISGSGGLTKNGAGTLTLSGNNTYTGVTTINAGILRISSDNNIGAAPVTASAGQLVLGGGTLATTATFALSSNRGISLSSTSIIDVASGTTLSYGGVADGLGGLTKSGAGQLTLTGTNTFTGVTNINEGVLNIQNAQGTGTSAGGVVVASGAALELQGAAVGAETLSLAGSGISGGGALRFVSGTNSWAGLITLTATTRINADAGTNTIDVASGNAIAGNFNLTIGGSGNLSIPDPIATGNATFTKDGNGILTLSGANTYTGITTVSAGTLRLGAAGVIADASNLVLNGGTLSSGTSAGFSETMGTLSVTGNSTIALGTGNHTLTFSASNGLSWTNGSLTVTGWAGSPGATGSAGKIVIALPGGLSSTQLGLINFQNYGGATQLSPSGEIVPLGIFYSLSGQSNPNLLTNWTSNADGSGSNPGNFTGDGFTFIVQSGHSYTTTAAWNITGTSTLQIDGTLILSHILTMGTATTKVGNLTVNGIVQANAQHDIDHTSGRFTINNGGKYILNHTTTNNETTTFNGIESFVSGSTFEYQNLNGTLTDAIVYHHLIFSGPTVTFPTTITIGGNLTVSAGTVTMNKNQTVTGVTNVNGGTLQISTTSTNRTLTATGGINVTGGIFNMATGTGAVSITGNVSVSNIGTFNMTTAGTSPGAPAITGNVTVSGGSFYAVVAGADAVTSTITGNLSVTGGTFYVTGNTANTTHILDLNGTLDLSNTGVIEFNPVAGASGSGRLYVNGNVTISGGTMQRTQTRTDGSTGIYFDGTTQTFTWSGGAILNAMPNRFYVNGVTTLNEVYSHSTSSQTTVNGSEGTPAAGLIWPTTINNLTINNTSGVTLSTPKTVTGTLTFNNGFLVSSLTNILTIANTNTNAITGAGTGKYVSGPLRWNLSNSPATYVFPVGKASGTNPGYYPFTIASSSVSSPVVTVEVFNTNAGGGICVGGGVTDGSLSTTEYWSATLNSGSLIGSASLTRPLTSLGSLDVIAQSATANGNYFGIGGMVSGSNSIINSTNINTFGFFRMGVKSTNCINPTNPGSILAPSNFPASGLFCGTSFTPTQISNDASNNPSGACSMEFKWQFSTDDGANWTDISSSNATSYTPSTITQTTWYKRVVRTLCKTDWSDATETTPVILALGCDNPSNGGVINAPAGYPANGVCGSSYAFTSAITNSIEASGACSIEYKWQSSTNNGASWTDISSSNATSYTPPTITQTTWYKRLARATCKADWNGAAETEPVKIILGNLLSTGGLISRNQGACGVFDPLQINSVSVAGPCTPKYKWQFRTSLTDWADISGATTASYDPPALAETTRYRRAAILSTSNDWSSAVFSNTVVMTVATAVGISLNPLNDTVYQETGVATFVAKSNFTTAGAATYQWQVSIDGGNTFNTLINGGYYTGVTDTILNVTNPIYAMNGYRYRCVITSVNTSCGTVTTNAAILSVLPIIVATNNNTLACNSWTASSAEVPITVSSVGVLNNTTNVLRQINLSIGNNGACKKALNTYSFSVIAPNGTAYKFIKGFTTTSTSVWANIQFRDHPALERIKEYASTVQQSYFPYSIGYYGVEDDNIFIPTFAGINANGIWKLRIEKNNGTAGGISLEKAELVFGPKIATKDVTGNSINNSCEFATCFGSDASVIIGTNNGYSQTNNYPGDNIGSGSNSCYWNQANNNSAWYYFYASSSSAYITVSGMRSISGTGGDDMQLVVLDGGSDCLPMNSPSWSVPTGGCSDDETRNNKIYLTPSLGGKGGISSPGNIYVNGITANAEFNLSGLTPGRRYLLLIDGNAGNPSSFYIEAPSGGQKCILENILPVRYISFDAFFKNGQTELFWKTAQEINNRHFLIERSGDGKNWEIIKVIPGASDRTELIRKYQTTDRNPLKGVNYYRLKQVDLDGRFSYSDIRTVHNNTINGLSLFPNPGNGWFIVSGLSKGIPHQIRVVDMAGKLMHSGNTNAAAESYRFNMDHAAPGVYFLQVDGKEYLRMVVTK